MIDRSKSVCVPADELVGEAANEFFAAIGRGEEPSIEAFVERYPEIADHIRRAFPALLLVGDCSKAEERVDLEWVADDSKTLGDFRLLRRIGRGGMGTVFEAEQISMGRRVALKVLPFAALVQQNSLQRFRNEVRAAAALNHPHIVPVYSIGEERGVHFYAMQLIHGRTLADLIGELRNNSPESVRKDFGNATQSTIADGLYPATSTVVHSRPRADRYREVARLGIQAAEALQHAHDQGVLHRDIKPSNLLLDNEGKLYVTDFGLARIEADAGLTMTGDLVGTLRYMSPEQVLGKRLVIDQCADVYSLGVTLYELIALQPAFGETDRSELLKRIALSEPTALRKIDRRIPIDLETIVLKAMAKDRSERLQTAQSLADDLKAFLGDLPIKARPPSLLNRTAKWSRRHWRLFAAAAVVLVTLTISSIVGTFKLMAERRQTAQAAAESKAVVDFLVKDLLASPQQDKDDNREVTVREVLQAAELKINSALGDQPLVEAAVRTAMANAYHAISKPKLAEPHARRALDIRSHLLPLDSADLRNSAEALIASLNEQEAHDMAAHEFEIRRSSLGESHPETVRMMAKYVDHSIPAAPDFRFDQLNFQPVVVDCLAKCRSVLGPDDPYTNATLFNLARITKDDTQSVQMFNECIANAQTTKSRDPSTVAVTLDLLGSMMESRRDPDRALKYYEEELRVCEQEWGSRDRQSVRPKFRIASVYIWSNRPELALPILKNATEITNKDMVDHSHWFTANWMLAKTLRKLGKLDEARRIQEEIIPASRRVYGANGTRTLEYIFSLVLTLATLHQTAEAHRLIDEIVELQPAEEFNVRNHVAWALAVMDVSDFRDGPRAVKIATEACQMSSYKSATAIDTLAAACAECGDFDTAIKWSETSIQLTQNDANRAKYRSHLEAFRQKKPWRADL